ncbi:MAG: RNA polymerase sigma factor [Ruminococcus sp.]|uniref:RNA polymerase sigma factor n=1 Tax=uncultured Ruminococcus sp. TaxID=165186 RepID=UPI0025EE5933|nr:sigma-70 family RNA polymerase sigma factor [uncultured Ruminococcus sp.]
METSEYIRIAEQYTDIVYRAAISYCKNKNDAEDAVQNTFVKLLKTDTEFNDDEHIRKWLIRVAVNECKNMWKSFWRRNVTSFEELEKEPEYIESDKTELFSEVMKLPQKYRVVLHLYYYEGYCVKEIAQLVGISESNVQTRLMRARNKLKLQLEE